MIDVVLLAELRQLYSLQLQAASQHEWGIKKQLNFLCMATLDETVSGALDSLYSAAMPESDPRREDRVLRQAGKIAKRALRFLTIAKGGPLGD